MSSMRESHDYRTICEVLREINDLAQHNLTIRKLLVEAQDMAKRMSRKMAEYNKSWDRDWWDRNPDKAADIERRLSKDYLCE